MATYPRVSPANLTAFIDVIDDPAVGEDANKLYLVDLQTRRFISDFLETKFDSSASDALKPAAVVDATLAGKVKGSTSNAGSQQAIVQGTISTPDLRDDCVTAAKIADGAISGVLLADDSVVTSKLGEAPNGVATSNINDLAVTTAKLAADSVDSAKLKDSSSTDADRAVTTDHIRDSAVTTGKIAANAVTGAKMVAGTSGQILVANGSGVFTPVSVTGDAAISNAGVVTIGAAGHGKVIERAANTVVGGVNSAATWNIRGVTVPWIKEYETVTSMIDITAGSGKISLAAGTYLLEVISPGYKVDEHICRISRYNVSNVLQESIYGTSEISTAADAVQTASQVLAKMTFVGTDYFKVEHWTKTANATDGFGHPTSSGGTYEIYTTIKVQKIA